MARTTRHCRVRQGQVRREMSKEQLPGLGLRPPLLQILDDGIADHRGQWIDRDVIMPGIIAPALCCAVSFRPHPISRCISNNNLHVQLMPTLALRFAVPLRLMIINKCSGEDRWFALV